MSTNVLISSYQFYKLALELLGKNQLRQIENNVLNTNVVYDCDYEITTFCFPFIKTRIITSKYYKIHNFQGWKGITFFVNKGKEIEVFNHLVARVDKNITIEIEDGVNEILFINSSLVAIYCYWTIDEYENKTLKIDFAING